MNKTNYAVRNASALRNLVTDYMFKTFWYAEVKLERETALESVNASIRGLENAKGACTWNANKALALVELYDERTALENQLDEWIVNAGAKWVLVTKTEDGKETALGTFGRVYQQTFKATGDADYAVTKAVNAFYSAFDLECGAQDMEYLQYVLGGLRAQHNAKAIAKSGQTVWTKARAKRDICETLLCALAEIMIEANAIRPIKIAPELTEKWASKKQKKQAQKNN